MIRRRALVCFASVPDKQSSSNLRELVGLHHRCYALAWPVTTEALVELTEDLRVDEERGGVVITSIAWLEPTPSPSWWSRLLRWLRGGQS